jgi:hypothetical protein
MDSNKIMMFKISEFSTRSFDAGDIFFDKSILRKAVDN